ncbi:MULTISPECIES: hypothetical protein [Bacillaceae]|uniref:Uncharacterized protein n=1 Tax=Domibacillus aminovorans TaxID=29332 RepID=A0A177KY17_9BACI|nr:MULTISPECIES: hypothetical protein [Bacillaceae]OAH57895.1 hypothetical protein AWH48_02490 [Domibacillus aminovorans]
MEKRYLPLFITIFIIIGASAPVYAYEDEPTGTPFEQLEKEGISLKHYIVTFKSQDIEKGYYRAVSSNGETLRFKQYDVEIELSVGDRIRSYWEDGGFNIAEYVKPKRIDYKVTRVWNEHNETYYEGTSASDGDIIFTAENVMGQKVKAGQYVTAEFDQMFIESGLICVYKKK